MEENRANGWGVGETAQDLVPSKELRRLSQDQARIKEREEEVLLEKEVDISAKCS